MTRARSLLAILDVAASAILFGVGLGFVLIFFVTGDRLDLVEGIVLMLLARQLVGRSGT